MLTFYLHPIVKGQCGCGSEACTRAGKHPAESWRDVPEDRPELVATADCGVGIKTGAVSGVFVVDLDIKNGVDGFANFSALGNVPKTYAVATPSGGFHLYFKHPGFPVRNSAPNSNPIAPGVDVRGDGGYVVAPGSPHKNGGQYTVACSADIAEAPAWLLARPELRRAEAELAAPATDIEERVTAIPRDWRVAKAQAWLATQSPAVEGHGGDPHTFKLLTRAVHEFCLTDADMIDDAFVQWNARCEPPWSGKEWAHKVDGALNHSTLKFDTIGLRLKHLKDTGAYETAVDWPPLPVAADLAPDATTVSAGALTFKVGGFDAPLPPIVWLIDGMICKADVAMLVAHGGSLKTWLAFSIALAVASGRPWLGKFVSLRGRAAVIDFESGEFELLRRFKLLGVKDADVGDRLLRSSYSGVQLSDPETWIGLAGLGLDLLVIDSFNAASPDTDENDARAAVMLQHAGRFAEHTGCTVIVIHHSRKGSGGDQRESVRGSTAIFAACDRVFKFDEPERRDGGVVLSTMSSVKDGAGRSPAPVRVELSDQGLRWVESEAKPVEVKEKKLTDEDKRELVLSILSKNSAGVAKNNLISVMGGKREKAFEILSQLELSGATTEYSERHGRVKKDFVMLKPGQIPCT